jgi:hypothetical protein
MRLLAIQGPMQGQIRASGENRKGKEQGSPRREGWASQQNMGNGSVGKGSGHKFTFPWVTLRRTGTFTLGVFPDETGQQLAHSLTVDFIPR